MIGWVVWLLVPFTIKLMDEYRIFCSVMDMLAQYMETHLWILNLTGIHVELNKLIKFYGELKLADRDMPLKKQKKLDIPG